MHDRTLPQLALLLLSLLAAGGAPGAVGCKHGADPTTRSHPSGAGSGTTGGAAPSPGLGGALGIDGTLGAFVAGSGGAGGAAGVGGGSGIGGAGGAGGGGNGGGAGGTSGTPGSTSSTSGAAQSASSSSSTSSSGSTACAIGHVVISQIRSRGAGGATDELVELFNATGSAVTLDATWVLEARGTDDASYRAHWTGAGDSVPAWGHFLLTGAGYAEAPSADRALSIGIVDAASLRLVHAGTTVDAVCFAFDAATQAAFDATFTCAGTPMSNLPHDNTASAASDVDASIARAPGGAGGNCADTGDNAADFVAQSPALPRSSASPPTP